MMRMTKASEGVRFRAERSDATGSGVRRKRTGNGDPPGIAREKETEMNRIVFGKEGEIRPAAVVLAGLILSTIAFALDWMIVRNAPAIFGSLGEVHEFGVGKALLASFPAVLGNTLGFYLSYRRPDPRALAKFLAPAAGFFVLFMIPPAWTLLLGGGTAATFATSTVLNIVPVSLAVAAFLALRPRPESAPEPVSELQAEPAVK